MGRGRSKGSHYERELSKELSRWWSDGKRDDIFWRSAGSGGWATNRAKKGKSAPWAGDIVAVDPEGAPLTRLLTIEAKRGHKDCHLGDVLDRKREKKPRWFEVFIEQAMRESKEAERVYWLLIVRRDSRDALVYMPYSFYEELDEAGSDIADGRPWVAFKLPKLPKIFCTTLELFFDTVTPDMIRRLAKVGEK